MRTRAIALVLALAGCNWAHQHGGVIAAGVTGATVGFVGCEVGNGKNSTCLAVSGGAALFLGGLAALAYAFLDTGEGPSAPPPAIPEMTNEGVVRVHSKTLAPPVPVDAGVVDAGVAQPDDATPAAADVAPGAAPVDAPAM